MAFDLTPLWPKGQAQEVDVSSAATFTIPVASFLTNETVDPSHYHPSCLFWDPRVLAFVPSVCMLSGYTSATIQCTVRLQSVHVGPFRSMLCSRIALPVCSVRASAWWESSSGRCQVVPRQVRSRAPKCLKLPMQAIRSGWKPMCRCYSQSSSSLRW